MWRLTVLSLPLQLVLPGVIDSFRRIYVIAIPPFYGKHKTSVISSKLLNNMHPITMFVGREVSYSWCKLKMMSFRGQTSWAKMTSPGGQAKGTCVPPDQKSKQS